MWQTLLASIAPIFIGIGIGFCWGKSDWDFPSEFVTRIVMNVSAPCLLVSVLTRSGVSTADLMAAASATLLVFLCSLAALAVFLKLMKQPLGTFLPTLVFGNTGNMGLPLCMFAFGAEGLAFGMGFFWVYTVLTFTLGMVIFSWGSAIRSSPWRVLREPLLYSSLVALLLVVTGTELPAWIGNSVDLFGGIAIPLMLVTLGVSLARLQVDDLAASTLYATARLGLGVLIGWGVAELMNLEGLLRGVIILQSAMPSAVFNYLLALRYGNQPHRVAGVVVLSTIISLITLPYLMSFVLKQAGVS